MLDTFTISPLTRNLNLTTGVLLLPSESFKTVSPIYTPGLFEKLERSTLTLLLKLPALRITGAEVEALIVV